ncbi:hypothetical protein [Aestuariibaculum lutulentum]|uniref:Uncharacterized protein n=1 Tax=Aestuariibaculum lutulentum TaxID=2920935 RepID=A0ABS9RKT5_9FLAO|nr:hypothetical protein [Aestuariibaculum lutulentum]MCH4553561.1 hypothetical protein [Aestuariibaculum lutulentum]
MDKDYKKIAEEIISIMKSNKGIAYFRDNEIAKIKLGFSEKREIMTILRDEYNLVKFKDISGGDTKYILTKGAYKFKSFSELEKEEKREKDVKEIIENKTIESFKYGKWGFWLAIASLLSSILMWILK